MNESNPAGNTGSANHELEGYGRRTPSEVGVQLRNLLNRKDFLTARFGNGQIVTRLLEVDSPGRTFIFDWGSVAADNTAVLAAGRLFFNAAPDGVRVEFATDTPREVAFGGSPAFEAAFPSVLYYLQRREYFRVETPVLDPWLVIGALPNGERFRFEMNDLSLGGVSLRTIDERARGLEAGMAIDQVELRFGPLGKVMLDLEVVSPREAVSPKGDRVFTVGFKFAALPNSAENVLQRLITQLEIKRGALAR